MNFGEVVSAKMSDEINLTGIKRSPSSFMPFTKPEDTKLANDVSAVFGETPTVRPAAPTVATLLVTTPKKFVISDAIKNRLGMFFPSLAFGKSLFKIKYKTQWQNTGQAGGSRSATKAVSYTHLRAHET